MNVEEFLQNTFGSCSSGIEKTLGFKREGGGGGGLHLSGVYVVQM